MVTFEQLGVDRLFVDEAHNYKNLFLYTKMRNVAGLSTSDAQKSSDMFAKCRYMDEITGNRGVIFATGTPVSNSVTELYTMQRYLQYERLQELNMTHFDCWASRFGETVTALELAPEGTGYRARTRFSKFFNLPELMNLFKEVADIKTADQLNLPTPEVEYHNIVAQPTEHQQEMVKALSERASLVHSGTVDPSQDNMLKITSDGRKLGLDQRIVNQMLPDEPGTKVNQCVDNIMQIWRDGEADKLTQLVFCDISTPQAKLLQARRRKRWIIHCFTHWKVLYPCRSRNRPLRYMTIFVRNSLPRGCLLTRSLLSMKQTPKSGRRSCSPKSVPVRCVCLWAVRLRWAQVPMCRTALWRCMTWTARGGRETLPSVRAVSSARATRILLSMCTAM